MMKKAPINEHLFRSAHANANTNIGHEYLNTNTTNAYTELNIFAGEFGKQ